MLKPITGLQCAILVAEHQRELIPWADKYVVRVMCCGSERRARSAGFSRLSFLILAPCSHACVLTICRYNSFLICLGMVRPVQVDSSVQQVHDFPLTAVYVLPVTKTSTHRCYRPP